MPLAIKVAYSHDCPAVYFVCIFDASDYIKTIKFPVDGSRGARVTSVETVHSEQHILHGVWVGKFGSPATPVAGIADE